METPTNQPTESKGEHKPWEVCALYDIHEAGPEHRLVASTDPEVPTQTENTKEEAAFHALLIAEAGTVYHDTRLTPRQLAERVKELEAKITTLIEDVEYVGGCAYWQHQHIEALKQNLEIATQLAASEAAREEMCLALVEALVPLAALKLTEEQQAYKEIGPDLMGGILKAHDTVYKALAQQPAEALEKREEAQTDALNYAREEAENLASRVKEESFSFGWNHERVVNDVVDIARQAIARATGRKEEA